MPNTLKPAFIAECVKVRSTMHASTALLAYVLVFVRILIRLAGLFGMMTSSLAIVCPLYTSSLSLLFSCFAELFC